MEGTEAVNMTEAWGELYRGTHMLLTGVKPTRAERKEMGRALNRVLKRLGKMQARLARLRRREEESDTRPRCLR